jgi:hypothetical protein
MLLGVVVNVRRRHLDAVQIVIMASARITFPSINICPALNNK